MENKVEEGEVVEEGKVGEGMRLKSRSFWQRCKRLRVTFLRKRKLG